MLRKTWTKLEDLVGSAVKAKYKEAVSSALSALERTFAEWVFVNQINGKVPNLIKVTMGTGKGGPIVVQHTVQEEIDRIKTLLGMRTDKEDALLKTLSSKTSLTPKEQARLEKLKATRSVSLSDTKRTEYAEKLHDLKGMAKVKKVKESAKAAAKRVDKTWVKDRNAFIKLLGRAASPASALVAKKLLTNLAKPLVGDGDDTDSLKTLPWEGDTELESWPVKKVRLLEDEARVVDLLHTALREVAASNYHPRVVAAVAEKYGLPHADVQWLSSVLSKKKEKAEDEDEEVVTAPDEDEADTEVEVPIHPSELVENVDHDRRAKTVWDSILGRVPRAMHHYLKGFEVVYEMGAVFPPVGDRKTNAKRFYLGKEHRKHFFTQGQDEPAVDMNAGIIYLPPSSASWSVDDMTTKLVSKAVDIFLQRSRLLTKGDMEKYISKFFISEQDIDKLLSSLNELALETEPGEDIRGLEEQVKKHYPKPEQAQRFHEWWAEHQGHFTHLLKDKRMIPLFHKWMVEVVMSMVNASPSPKDVPYPVAKFMTKMSSLDRLKQTAAGSILNIRMELMKTPGTEDVLQDLKEAASHVI
jgi:hypothetical protein